MFIALSASGHTSDKIFNEAKKKFDKKDYENSKFLFQRNIVFYPKSAESYLYLAKIFNNEENQQQKTPFKFLRVSFVADKKQFAPHTAGRTCMDPHITPYGPI